MRNPEIKNYLKNLKRELFMLRDTISESDMLKFEVEIRTWEIVLAFRSYNKIQKSIAWDLT